LRAGKVSGILGLVAMSLLLLGCPSALGMAILAKSEAVLVIAGGGVLALSLIGSSVAIVLAAYSRMAGAWAIVGLVTGIVSILGGLALTTFVALVGV